MKLVTKKWMQDLLSALTEDPLGFKIHEYRHWSDNSDADVDYEASCLKNISVDIVIAKSLGTLIATHAFDSFHFTPKNAVLIGTPLKRHSPDNYGLLNKFVESVPTLFIQQTSDFHGSCRDLREVVQTCQNAIITEVPGDDHIYNDIDELQRIIKPIF